jgi:putative drug exporter of the RND superfamily
MTSLKTVLSTRGLARVSSRHPLLVFACWAGVIALSMVLAATVLPGVLTTSQDFTNNPESLQGQDLRRQAGFIGERTFQETIVIRSSEYTVDDPEYVALARGLLRDLGALMPDTISGFAGYHATGDQSFVSQDRRITFIPIRMTGPASQVTDQVRRLHDLVDAAKGVEGFEVLQTGDTTLDINFQEIAEHDLIKGESIGVGVALIILLLVFGTVVSALVPVLMALVAITVAVGLSSLVGLWLFDLSFFVTNMITMMGLAVGIDYSLFIVSRYREEVANGRDRLDAIQAAGATASRAVFFSGITVVLAQLGLDLLPTTMYV